ncbi:hypothetical protein EVAR_45979_1 [Eumeta japonica]|uniref:Uncharacterized protein n=1 Tax=Eumeta variegata TaxID=151549 RepID=A0A4C1YKX8_EUMVA|nr:hypothetical protein EVAR_45979_1 [Eumeta japonica]
MLSWAATHLGCRVVQKVASQKGSIKAVIIILDRDVDVEENEILNDENVTAAVITAGNCRNDVLSVYFEGDMLISLYRDRVRCLFKTRDKIILEGEVNCMEHLRTGSDWRDSNIVGHATNATRLWGPTLSVSDMLTALLFRVDARSVDRNSPGGILKSIVPYASYAWALTIRNLSVRKMLNTVQRSVAPKAYRAHRTVTLHSAMILSRLLLLDVRFERVDERDSHTLDRVLIDEPYIYNDGSRIERKIGAALTERRDGEEIRCRQRVTLLRVIRSDLLGIGSHEGSRHGLEPLMTPCAESTRELEPLKVD